MTRTVNVHDAKTHLSKLLVDVERGNEIVIARRGEPVARLVRYDARPPRAPWGSLELPGPPIPDSVWDPMTDDELLEWGLL